MTSGRSILLVDRNAKLLKELADRCQAIGLDVLTAKDASSAVRLLEQHAPDLVCLDDQTPGDEGLSFCEMVVGSPDDVPCPVIVLLGRERPTAAMRSSEMCVYYLHKRPNLWRYLEPVIYELVDIQPAARSPVTGAASSDSRPEKR